MASSNKLEKSWIKVKEDRSFNLIDKIEGASVDEVIEFLTKTYKKPEYERVVFELDYYPDSDIPDVVAVIYRKETDEEYSKRLEKRKKELSNAKKRRVDLRIKKELEERALYEKLKQKFEK